MKTETEATVEWWCRARETNDVCDCTGEDIGGAEEAVGRRSKNSKGSSCGLPSARENAYETENSRQSDLSSGGR
jgi:hypothetical protein